MIEVTGKASVLLRDIRWRLSLHIGLSSLQMILCADSGNLKAKTKILHNFYLPKESPKGSERYRLNVVATMAPYTNATKTRVGSPVGNEPSWN